MLTPEAINNAMALTDVLSNSNIVLTAIPNSPLEALVKATRAADTFVTTETDPVSGTGTTRIDTDTILFMANKADETLNICQHDVAMDEIVEVASKAVQGHISFARSVVTSAINNLVVSTKKALEEINAASILKMNVVQIVAPAPLSVTAFEDIVSPFAEGITNITPLNLNLASLTAAEIKELLSTGNGSVDDAVNVWAAIKGDEFLTNTWDNIFRIVNNDTFNTTARSGDLSAYIDDEFNGVDHAIFVFLIAHRLYDNPLPETPIALDTFNNVIVEYRNQAAIRVKRGIANLIDINKNKVLVSRIDNGNISVNDSVYGEWIQNGGDIEILFGNAISANPNYLVSFIDQNAEALKAAWLQHAALTMTTENNHRFRRTKEYFDLFFRKSLKEKLQNNEAGYSVAECEQYIQLFTEQLEQLTEAETTELYTAALKLVCRSEFYKTEAERILLGIEEAKRVSPNISVREAAAISIINYIAYWVSTQIKYEKVS